MMTNFRNLIALTATAAVVAVGHNVVAQDDYDELEEGLGALLNEDAGDALDADGSVAVGEFDDTAGGDEIPGIADLTDDGEEPTVADADEPEEPEEPTVADAEEPEESEEPTVADAEEPEEPEEPTVADAEEPEEPEEPTVADAEEPEEPEEPTVADADEPEEPEEPTVADADEPSESEEPVVAVAEEPAKPSVVTPQPVAAVTPAPAESVPVASAPMRYPNRRAAAAAAKRARVREAGRTVEGLSDEDKKLVDSVNAADIISAISINEQAEREMAEADRLFEMEEYFEAARHYALALSLMDKRSPLVTDMRKACETGISEGLYKAAMREYALGRRERAMAIIDKAIDHKHPKAKRQKAMWEAEGNPDAERKGEDEIRNVRNDPKYKQMRETNNRHLARATQLFAQDQLDDADDECGLVLLSDPYNREAMLLRKKIQRKRHTRYQTEREATREGMMSDVDRAWRPVYAIDAREVETLTKETTSTPTDKDPERAQEQNIIKKMKEMRLPAISFKPPATIIDAVDFFRTASKDFDSPELPFDERGFNFTLRTPETLRTAAPAAENDEGGFTEDSEEAEGGVQAGVPVIPMITASNISFYEALKLVCESVDYKFKVQGKMIVVMHKSMTTAEMTWRSYPVLSTFIDRVGSATEDMKEMRSGGFGGGGNANDDVEQSQEQDWKALFEELGVSWPEGSSIKYFKTLGKLRVRNTYENLAEIEQALSDLNAKPLLIEIETRFVEVCQEDLNSLGFEWILNSDYTLNLSRHAGRLLGVRPGLFKQNAADAASSGSSGSAGGTTTVGGVTTTTQGAAATAATATYASTQGASWVRGTGSRRNVGVSSMGGESEYGSPNRYLSTLSNHISGEGYATNDQFMRINAFLGGADISMILHMLNQRSDTDLLSAPKVLTKPGEQAIMKVVTEFIYPTDYNVQLQQGNNGNNGNWNNGGGGGGPSAIAIVEPESFTMREVGVILDVTPRLTDDGNLIDLDLSTTVVDEPTWKNYGMRIPFSAGNNVNFEGIGDILTGLSDVLQTLGAGLTDTVRAAFAETAVNSATQALDGLTQNTSENMTYFEAPMEQPFFHVRQVNSQLSVYPGATIVMGGLITEERKAMDDKVPFLGDLPFIGRLFRSHSEQTKKRNLLIFVTTRLVDTQGRELRSRDDTGSTASSAPVTPAPSVSES